MTDHSLPDRANGRIHQSVSPVHPRMNSPAAFNIDTPATSSPKHVRTLGSIIAASWIMGCCLIEDLRRYLHKHIGVITKASKVFVTTGGFIIACIGIWSAIHAMEDSRKAVKIAEWTAKKDFIEYCQATENLDAGCTKAQSSPLGPPPISWIRLKARMLQQVVRQKVETFPGSTLVLLGFPLAVTLWVSLRTTLGRNFRGRLRYIAHEHQRPVGLLVTAREDPRTVTMTTNGTNSGVDVGMPSHSQTAATRRVVFGSGVETDFDFSAPSIMITAGSGLSTSHERLPRKRLTARKGSTVRKGTEASPPIKTSPSQNTLPLESVLRERPYACQRCFARFRTEEELEGHSYIHTPVWCWECELGFAVNPTMQAKAPFPLNIRCSLAGPDFCHQCEKQLRCVVDAAALRNLKEEISAYMFLEQEVDRKSHGGLFIEAARGGTFKEEQMDMVFFVFETKKTGEARKIVARVNESTGSTWLLPLDRKKVLKCRKIDRNKDDLGSHTAFCALLELVGDRPVKSDALVKSGALVNSDALVKRDVHSVALEDYWLTLRRLEDANKARFLGAKPKKEADKEKGSSWFPIY
ncbi:hypothetical protein QBC40DRAFT_71213 [Triangularia verruculosa]|uniref:C2H2-type domain-containing protein n=1 Tax=Triangularia verruculosa TaxID=2587418 RepID=A0AAN6XGU1_9PEZI|nr:hypothetical protein QBC40DRAFT_71213 [Triangularia verruculosa]